jgi:hypothetical protein
MRGGDRRIDIGNGRRGKPRYTHQDKRREGGENARGRTTHDIGNAKDRK